jgi:hypothetical protein
MFPPATRHQRRNQTGKPLIGLFRFAQPPLFLDEWCNQVMRSRIEPMKKIARSLRSHRMLILNYFHAKKQFSSGIVEGLNNKAKLTMRKSYGFRTFHVLETALYHALGKLPGKRGKTRGTQVQQSSATRRGLAIFRHRCVSANRIDS